VCLNFGLYGASVSRGGELRRELGTLSPSSAVPVDSGGWAAREAYVGRVGALLANQYFLRWQQAIERAYDLHGCGHDPGRPFSSIQVYVSPETVVPDGEYRTPFGFRAGWSVDTQLAAGTGTKLGYDDAPPLAWSDEFTTSIRNLYMFDSSHNESMIFEDWQGTHGLSTVGGLVWALQTGGEVTEISKEGDYYAIDTWKLNGTTLVPSPYTGSGGTNLLSAVELIGEPDGDPAGLLTSGPNPYSYDRAAAMLSEIPPTGTLIAPTNRVVFEYTDEDSSNRTLAADVYICESPDSVGFLFSLDPVAAPTAGGGTDWAYDPLVVADQGMYFDINSFFSSPTEEPPGWVDYIPESWSASSESVIRVDTEQTVNTANYTVVSSDGDPVNLTDGEFYHDSEPDIAVRSTGFDLSIRRKYRSQLGYNGPFGVGWAWNHAERIFETGISAGSGYDGNVIHYHTADRTIHTIRRLTAGGFEYPPGTTYCLEELTGGGWEIHRRDLITITFDADGFLIGKRDRNGNTLAFNRATDGSGRLLSIEDRFGRKLQFTYGAASGKIEKALGPAGRACFYLYGASAYTTFVAMLDAHDPGGRASAKLSAALQRVIDAEDTVTTFQEAVEFLGSADDLVAFADPAGSVTTYQYLQLPAAPASPMNHNLCRYTLPNGDYLQIGYYGNDTVSYHENAEGETFNFAYSFYHRYAETWNEKGWYRKVYWNGNHDVVRMDAKDGCIETMTYDPNTHDMLSSTDANGHETTFTYDGRRNLTSRSKGGETWTYTYVYASGTPTEADFYRVTRLTVADPRGNATVSDFDVNGNLVDLTGPEIYGVTHRLHRTYDQYGNPDVTIHQQSTNGIDYSSVPNASTDNTYDATLPCLLTQQEDGYGAVTSFAYDGSGLNRIGLLTRVEDAADSNVHSSYNELGQPVRVTVVTEETADDGTLPATEYEYDSNHRLVATTDPALAVTQTIYGVSRDIVTGAQVAVSIDPYGYSTRFDYDAVGSLVRRTDRRGSTTTFTHDARGRVRSRTDALGNLTRYRYDGKGNLTAVTDAGGNTTSYTYDYADRRTGETDAAGNRVTYAYDLNGNLETVTRVTDPQGSTPWNVVTVFEYDESNRRTSRTVFGDADRDGVWDAGEDGRKWEWEYDALGRRTRETDPEEHYSRWCYDSDGALPSLGMDEADSDGRRYAFTPDPASPGRNVLELRFRKAEGASPDLIAQTVTEFDSRGLVRCTRDANGNATTFRYDAARRLTARTDPLGTRTEYEYDVVGNLIATRTIENYGEQDERLLARTEFAYNLRREQISRTRCLLNETGSIIERRTEAISHDPNGNPEARIDERGELWTSHFDALNRNIAGADPLGNLAVRGYDPVGNLTYTLDPLDNITEYAYDARNLVTAAIDPVGNTVKNEYDELGRHTRTRTVRDSQYPNLDIVTRTDYDPFGDPAAVTRADGVGANIESLTEYTRDGLGRVTRILADQDQSTALEYDVTFDRDAAGRVIRETDSDNSDAEYEYDAAGNLVFETGRSGQVIGRVYDAGGRVTDIYTFPAGTRPASPAEIPTDPDGTLRQHFEYDGLGRITAATDYNGTGTGDDHTVEYVYNSLSELIEEIQDGTVVTVRYDERSDPVGLDYPSGAMLDITRDERGLPTDFQYDRGTGGVQVAAIGYDAAGRLQSVHFGSGVDLDRDLDPRSLELGRSYDRSGPVLTVAGGTAATAYDERGNLLHEAVSGQIAAGAQTVRGFTYDERSRLIGQDDDGDQTADVTWALDKLGNWTATNQNGSAETRTVNADNEYATLDAFIPVYDDNGNLLQPDSWTTCEYDWADRLVSVTIVSGGPLAPVSVTCTYDALNRRVTRTAATVTTRYVYSGSQVVEEYEDEVLARRFVPGPGLDQPILMDNVSGANAGSYYYLRNRQGSVLALTDVDGNVVESYCYSAYGTPTLFDSSGQVLAQSAYGNPYGYTGRRRDPESALWYYRNRYYSDRLGRFLTRDPAGYVDGLDLYQYALGNPLAYTDPWGLSAKAGFSYWGVANAISSPVGALAGALVDRASAATDRAASQFLQSDIPGTNALAAYLAANAEMQRQIGGAAAGMLQPVRAAEAGYNRFTGNYQLARETGSSIPGALYYSSQMSFNPMVGMAEGATGRVLSQPESFNTELSGFVERFGRASTSLGETLFTVAGGLELYRMGFPAPRSRVGYHATDPDVAPLIEQNGFRQGTAPGRLGSHGTYVNSTPEGAIAEFTAHNPGKTPAVLKVKYSPGVEAVTDVAPVKYVDSIPLNVDSVTAPSVRLPSTTNTNVFNGTVQVLERVQ
jgi:RHS repeat-associated protein